MRHTTVTLIILAVIDLAVAGMLWFGYTSIEGKRAEKSDIQQQLVMENQRGERLRALRNTLVEVKDDRAAMEKYLFDPSEENQIAFLSTLEGLGTKSTGAAVNTESLDLSESEKKEVLNGKLSISGSWEQTYRVLSLVENLPLRIQVDQWSAKRDQQTPGSPDKWSGKLGFVVLGINPDHQ